MKKGYLLFVVFACFLSCEYKNLEFQKNGDNEGAIVCAKTILQNFMNTEVETKGEQFEGIQIEEAFLLNSISAEKDIPIYEIKLKKSKTEGYAIVIGDERIGKVLAYVPFGSLNDTLTNEPLKWYINSIPEIVSCDLKAYNESLTKQTKLQTKSEQSGTIVEMCTLPTSWGQASPYNSSVTLNCPSNTPSHGGKAPAGCVSIAISQVMAYHKYPNSFDWNLLLSSKTITVNDPVNRRNEIGRLVADAGNKAATTYRCDRSSSDIYSARTALQLYGYTVSSPSSFSLQTITSSLANKNPVIISGVTTENKGHQWVIDGWRQNTMLNPYGVYETHNYLSMNWGNNGNSNGIYYVSSPMSFIPTGTSYEFAYSFRFITIQK